MEEECGPHGPGCQCHGADPRAELLIAAQQVEEAYAKAEREFNDEVFHLRLKLGITEDQLSAMLKLMTLHAELGQARRIRNSVRSQMALVNLVMNMDISGGAEA